MPSRPHLGSAKSGPTLEAQRKATSNVLVRGRRGEVDHEIASARERRCVGWRIAAAAAAARPYPPTPTPTTTPTTTPTRTPTPTPTPTLTPSPTPTTTPAPTPQPTPTPTPKCSTADVAGDTFAAATAITLFAETEEYICPADDDDWWKFSAIKGQVITADLPAPLPADYDLDLYAPDDTLVEKSRKTGSDKSETILQEATSSGDWRVRVYGKPGTLKQWSNKTPYSLTVRACNELDEDDDTFDTATLIEPSVPSAGITNTYTGYLCPDGDVDWYAFSFSGGTGTIRVDLTNLPGACSLQLYNPNETLVASGALVGRDSRSLTYKATSYPGYWGVRIAGTVRGRFDPTQTYTLEVKLSSQVDLTVEGIEVTQAIQTLTNSVNLVVGKPTIARVYVGTGLGYGSQVSDVTVRLSGWKDCYKCTALTGSPHTADPQDVQGETDIADMRASTAKSVNFYIPASWQNVGTIYLEAQVNPNKTHPEASYTNNTKKAIATFTKSDPMNVMLVPISAGGLSPSLSSTKAYKAIAFLRAVFPVAKLNIYQRSGGAYAADYDYCSQSNTKGSCGAGWDAATDAMAQVWSDWANRPSHAYVVGLIEPDPACSYITMGCVNLGSAGAAALIDSSGGGHAAHELGHHCGLKHPGGSSSIDEYGVDVWTVVCFPTSSTSDPVSAPWAASDIMGLTSPFWIQGAPEGSHAGQGEGAYSLEPPGRSRQRARHPVLRPDGSAPGNDHDSEPACRWSAHGPADDHPARNQRRGPVIRDVREGHGVHVLRCAGGAAGGLARRRCERERERRRPRLRLEGEQRRAVGDDHGRRRGRRRRDSQPRSRTQCRH